VPEENPVETLSQKKSKQTWARLIKKVFEVGPGSLQSKLTGSFGECQNYTVFVLMWTSHIQDYQYLRY